MLKLTIFGSDYTSSKVPISPFDDNTFVFKTVDVKLKDTVHYLSSYFILNRSYDINSVRLRRTKQDLHQYLIKEFEYLIIDIDEVKSEYSQKKIIYYFKSKGYNVVLCPSRSHNGIDNFNMKGIIQAKGLNNRASIKFILNEIKTGLFQYGTIDLSSLNEGAYQAPSYKDETILFNEGGYIPEAFLVEEVKKEHITLTDSKVLDVCIDHYRSLGFEIVDAVEEKNLLSFAHPSEKTPKGYFLYVNNPFKMHHFNPDKGFSIFKDVRENQVVKNYIEEYNREKRRKELVGVGQADHTLNRSERYLEVGPQVKEFIDDWYVKEGLLKIKSAMGTGKSNIIANVIKKVTGLGHTVLMITNRVTVAKDFKKKYGIKLYNEDEYQPGDNLIVQLESLWRYSLKDFDVVIMDEFMSLMIHSRNNMSDYSNLNKVKLQYGLRNKMCVIADAFLYGDEDMFVTSKPVFMINNTYREDINVFEYSDDNSFISSVINKATESRSKREKVSVSCTSKIMVQVLERILEDRGFKVMALTSESTDADKEVIFGEFEKEGHNSWHVLLYTPTLTVGVSNLNRCTHHFHYDEGNTADVISSLQMIRRSRTATNIHLLLKQRKRHLETNVKILNEEVQSNITRYYKQTKNSLLITIDEEGDFVLSDTGRFVNTVEAIYNKLENDHRDSFEILMSHQIKNDILISAEGDEKFDIKSIKGIIKAEERARLIETLKKLDDVEYSKDIVEEYKHRTHIANDKDRLLKLMSEVKEHMRSDITEDQLKAITLTEIENGFGYIKKIKKLHMFLSKNEQEMRSLVSYVISEDVVNREQVRFFNYMVLLKAKAVKLKQTFTLKEIKDMNAKLGYGEFRDFITKIGYKKVRGKYTLSDQMIQDGKLIK